MSPVLSARTERYVQAGNQLSYPGKKYHTNGKKTRAADEPPSRGYQKASFLSRGKKSPRNSTVNARD